WHMPINEPAERCSAGFLLPFRVRSLLLGGMVAPAPADALSRRPVWQAPLVPVALALTAGILLDRFGGVSLALCLTLSAASLLLWVRLREGVLLLWVGVFLFGAGYHAWRVRQMGSDSIGHLTELEDHPVRLEGRVASEPQPRLVAASPLRTF